MKKIILFLSVITLITSCSSDADPLPVIVPLDVNANTGFLKKKVETFSFGRIDTIEFTYNGNKIVKINHVEDQEYEVFTYTGDLITKIETYDFSNVLIYKELFSYNTQGKLDTEINLDYITNEGHKYVYSHNSASNVSTSHYTGDLTSQTTYDITYMLTLSNGNLISDEIYTSTYDNKLNPYDKILGYNKLIQANNFGVNNTLTYDDIYSGRLETFSYTYNTMNYPLTVIDNFISYSKTTQYTYY